MPDLLIRLRLEIYSHWMETGRAPLASELSTALDQDVDSALDELAAAHTIVFEQGSKQIRMAHPFSAAPTPYAVRSEGISYWANCAWDSLGIAAMLGRDTEAPAVCAVSGAPVDLGIRSGKIRGEGVVHLLVPARHFWDDIVFT